MEVRDLQQLAVLVVLVDSEALLVMDLAAQEEGQVQEILQKDLVEGLGPEALEGLEPELELVLVQMKEGLVQEA